jgi:cytochrome P450
MCRKNSRNFRFFSTLHDHFLFNASATSLSFLLLELAKNPIEQFKLQKELRELSEEDQVNSEQLKRCIRESLRLYPVSAPGPFRQLGRDFVVRSIDEKEKDTMIPKGSAVFMPIICLLRHPEIFEDCDNFVPSRWEQPTEEMKLAYMPFALGKRNCFGQSLANSEMQYIASRLCSKYQFDVVDPGTCDFTLVYHPVGAKVKATRI